MLKWFLLVAHLPKKGCDHGPLGNYRARIQISLQAARKHKPDFSGACYTWWWANLAEISAHAIAGIFKGSPCASVSPIQGIWGLRGGAGACTKSGVRRETPSRLSICFFWNFSTGFDYSQSPSDFSPTTHREPPKKAVFPKEKLLAQGLWIQS